MAELRVEVTPAETAGDIYKLVNGDVDVKIVASTKEELVKCLDTLSEVERLLLDAGRDFRVTTLMKHLPFELRLEAIKWIINLDKADKVLDSILTLDVVNLIKGYTSCDDSFFQNENIIVNSMTELADLKRSLKGDIKLFVTQLSNCFLSIIRSASVTDFQPKDEPKKLSSIMHNLISMGDFITLSSILRKADVISTDKLFNVVNAAGYLLTLSRRFSLGGMLAEATLPIVKEQGE